MSNWRVEEQPALPAGQSPGEVLPSDAMSAEPLSPAVSAEQMKLVLNVSRMLAATADLDKLLLTIAEATTALLDCERASIFLHDPRTGELWTKIALQSAGIRLPSNKGIVGHAFTSNQILHVPRPYEDPRFNPQPDRNSGFTTRNLLAVPMVDWERNPVGVVQAINKRRECGFGDADVALLQLLADQAGVAIQRYHLHQAAVESTALRKEMELAKRVQEACLPKGPVQLPGLEATGWTQAASINGGDCFDLWPLPDQRLGILVADASGHGMAPALVVSQVRALIRTLSETESDPTTVLRRTNGRLARDLDRGRFCTVFLGFLAPDGELSWCSGGHGPIVLHSRGSTQLLDATMPPVGILDDLPGDAPLPVTLERDARLVVTTDGITESFNPRNEMYGTTRVLRDLDAVTDGTTDAVIQALRHGVTVWQEGLEPVDDQTAVAVRRIP